LLQCRPWRRSDKNSSPLGEHTRMTFLLLLLLVGRLAVSLATDLVVMGYVPEYRFGGVDFDVLATRTNVLTLFSLELDAASRLVGTDRFPADVMDRARAAKLKHGTKLLVSLGGGGRSTYFRSTLNSFVFSERLAATLAAFVAQNGLDGVDVDWEDAKVDERAYVRFLTNLRKALPEGAQITVALHVKDPLVKALSAVADAVNLMAYDLCVSVPCRHSTLQHAAEALDAAVKAGAEARKLVIGIPLYGRVMKTGDAVPFYDIVKNGKVRGDVDATNTIHFNGRQTIAAKIALVRERGARGIFFWEVGQDHSEQSLLATAWQDAQEGVEKDREL
jgi:GH18 family chitinase